MMLKTIFYFCIGLYSFSITETYCTSQEVDVYKEIKALKQHPSIVVNHQYLDLLKKLEVVADQGDFVAQKHYISAVRYLKWNPDILLLIQCPQILIYNKLKNGEI